MHGGLHKDGCLVMDTSSRRKRPRNMHGEFVYNNIIPMQPEYLRIDTFTIGLDQNWIDLEKKVLQSAIDDYLIYFEGKYENYYKRNQKLKSKLRILFVTLKCCTGVIEVYSHISYSILNYFWDNSLLPCTAVEN